MGLFGVFLVWGFFETSLCVGLAVQKLLVDHAVLELTELLLHLCLRNDGSKGAGHLVQHRFTF